MLVSTKSLPVWDSQSTQTVENIWTFSPGQSKVDMAKKLFDKVLQGSLAKVADLLKALK